MKVAAGIQLITFSSGSNFVVAMNGMRIVISKSVLAGIGLALRMTLGLVLFSVTVIYAALFIDLGLTTGGVMGRVLSEGEGLLFVVVACVVWKILLWRRHQSLVKRFNFPPQEGFGPGLEGALVPKPTRPKLPTLSAMEPIPIK